MTILDIFAVAALERRVNDVVRAFDLDGLSGVMNASRSVTRILIDEKIIRYEERFRVNHAEDLARNAIAEVPQYGGRKAMAASRILRAWANAGILNTI